MAEINVTIRPLSTAERRMRIAVQAIMLVYTASMAWQVAKVMFPQLNVREQILVDRVKAMFRAPQAPYQFELAEFAREIEAYEHEARRRNKEN